MKNKLSDLNDHLFAQLERLSDEQIKGDELQAEIERGKAITSVSREIVSMSALVLKAETFKREYGVNSGGGLLGLEQKKDD